MTFPISNVLILLWLLCVSLSAQSVALSAGTVQTNESAVSAESTILGKITSVEGPVGGAIVNVFREELVAKAISNEGGEFQIVLKIDKPAKILVMAGGKLSQILPLDPKKQSWLEIQLEIQKAPLRGRIIDNQGIPVTNAKLRVLSVRQGSGTVGVPRWLMVDQFDSITNQKGAFQFDGIDPTMVGTIQVTGQGIVTSLLTRESFTDEIVLIAQPGRVVKGKVIDRISKQPISNVMVSLASDRQQVQVNNLGEFEVKGLPAFRPLVLVATPNGEKPYLSNAKPVPVEHGFDPVKVELELEPGVWVKCKVRDFGNNRPTAAQVYYFPTPENENSQSYVESFLVRGSVPSTSTNSFGEANVVAIPGPGLVAIVAEGFQPNESVNKLTDEQRAMLLGITGRNDLTAVSWIEPKDLKDQIELSFLVSKGRAIDVEVVENQLEATDQLVVHGAASKTSYSQPVLGTKFVAEQFQPGETRRILIHAPRKRLSAILNVEAEAKSPVQVGLEPTGSVIGQVVNQNGDPQPGLSIQFEIQTDEGYQEIATPVFTDANGRFEKPSLIAALEYRVAAVRLTKSQQLMAGAPMMDSRWYVAEELKIMPGEAVELGTVVLGASRQPHPTRRLRKAVVEGNISLPKLIAGLVTNESGEPVTDATILFNTWPNRSGDLQLDAKLMPKVLAQSRTDSSGNFQLTIDESLDAMLIASDARDGIKNSAIVVMAEKLGAIQIPLQEISDPRNLKIKMTREMVVRGRVPTKGDGSRVHLSMGARMDVYDGDSIKQIVAGLQAGNSLNKMSREFEPQSTLDPLAGGLPLNWEVSSSGAFLVRNIPFNAIFELHAIGETGRLKTITVISRPMSGFEIKLSDDAPDTMQLQGSRIMLDLGSSGKPK